MLDDFRVDGVWWLPSRPARKIRGTLTFSANDDIRLALGGVLSAGRRSKSPPDVVLGRIDEGRDCTVLEPMTLVVHGTSSGVSTSEMRASNFLLGAHYRSVRDVRPSRMDANFLNLEGWLQAPAIRNEQTSDGMIMHASIRERPAPLDVAVPTIKARIYAGSSFTATGGGHGHSLSWEQTDFLTIHPHAPRPLAWYLKSLFTTQGFLTLFALEPAWPRIVELEDDQQRRSTMFVPWHGRSIGAKMVPWRMLAQLPALSDKIETVLNRWFEDRDVLGPTVDSLLGTLYKPSQFLENHFLTLMHALEAFHRRTTESQYVTAKEYASYRAKIVAGIPADVPRPLREKLKSTLRWANEFSLRKRLTDILKGLAPETRSMLHADEKWVGNLVDTRNYYTHYTEDLGKLSMTHLAMAMSLPRLKALLLILLLRHLGIPEERAIEFVMKNPEIKAHLGSGGRMPAG